MLLSVLLCELLSVLLSSLLSVFMLHTLVISDMMAFIVFIAFAVRNGSFDFEFCQRLKRLLVVVAMPPTFRNVGGVYHDGATWRATGGACN